MNVECCLKKLLYQYLGFCLGHLSMPDYSIHQSSSLHELLRNVIFLIAVFRALKPIVKLHYVRMCYGPLNADLILEHPQLIFHHLLFNDFYRNYLFSFFDHPFVDITADSLSSPTIIQHYICVVKIFLLSLWPLLF